MAFVKHRKKKDDYESKPCVVGRDGELELWGKEGGITPKTILFFFVGIVAHCYYMNEIFNILSVFGIFFFLVGVDYYNCLRFLTGIW